MDELDVLTDDVEIEELDVLADDVEIEDSDDGLDRLLELDDKLELEDVSAS